MADEKTSNPSPEDKTAVSPAAKAKSKAKGATGAKGKPEAKPAAGAKAKKPKPPKLEDKPFSEFIQQHYLPTLESALQEEGIAGLTLAFEKAPIEVIGAPDSEQYWQVIGKWNDGGRQFNVAFINEDITGQKIFTCATNGAKASTIEQFMGDERRITLGLLVQYTVQRLNGQKWLTGN